ncbi:MAG TPA: universal stress protein [Pseudonocardiaceae bacterium]|nr:universal stress protein [Pseudonocardiaceae bacterium]
MDGSHWGRMALHWAAEHAWLAGAELEVHAVAHLATGDSAADEGVGHAAEKFPLLPIRVRSESEPAAALVRASREADWVVLGRRADSRHGIGIGGSVLPVANRALCDVIVVGGAPEEMRGAFQRVTVLWTGPADAHALRAAARLAAARDAALHVLRPVAVCCARHVQAPTDVYLAELDRAAGQARRWQPNVRTTTELAWMNPHELVVRPGSTDVLVIGIADRVDAVGRTALFHSPAPVLIAHNDRAHDDRVHEDRAHDDRAGASVDSAVDSH